MTAGLPDLSGFCITMSTGPGELCIRMPAGARVCAQFGFETGDAGEITRSLMGQVNSAITPLAPIFSIIDAVKAIVDCVQAIPQTIVELSPAPILKCIPDLVKKLAKLLELIPQLSVPILVADLLEALVVGLLAIRGELAAMLAQQQRLTNAIARQAATGNADLQAVITCAQGNLDAQLQNKQTAMAPLNRILEIVNILLELAGLPQIDPLGSLGHLDASILATIDTAIQALEIARAALPV